MYIYVYKFHIQTQPYGKFKKEKKNKIQRSKMLEEELKSYVTPFGPKLLFINYQFINYPKWYFQKIKTFELSIWSKSLVD